MRTIEDIYFKIFRRLYLKKGYSQYYLNFYRKELKENYKKCTLPKKQKKWAYKRGFNGWRIAQYGLNEDNYREIMSDRDYFYLYPINNRYKLFIDDKLTIKYVLAPFDKYLPRYYYHVMKDRGIMRLMDCPEGYASSIDDLIRLIEEKKTVAAKMTAGTYGIGFYKIEAENGKFVVNSKEYDKEQFKFFILSLSDYIITEFVEMHSELKKINPYAVNTIRLTVINEDGTNPSIPFAFMRIGTKKSGIVDNVAQGGMVCKIDVETGRYYGGQVLKNHVYEEAEYHPDTNVKIEGVIPHWELIKREIINIGNYCPQLKWLGYDIAVTENGFSIIEINSHHGLHKAHEYPSEVNDFLFRELEAKKKKYNIKRV